ncbi:MAG: SDR family oxidoreductase [Balneolaceae bacterium]|nr:SDR family oxidoreductase [Balneolaceae bacterium]
MNYLSRYQTALVTGCASGIGFLMAREMLERGVPRLVAWDNRPEALEEAAQKLRETGGAVTTQTVDVTDRESVDRALGEVRESGISIDVLINNAGIVTGGPFALQSPEAIRATMEVNSLAPMLLARELLPGMIERDRGHIVNISSAAGMLGNPDMATYSASKWALTGWSDSLHLEMERAESGVKVLTVAPYYIDTGMFEGVRSPLLPILDPGRTAARIVRAIDRGSRHLRMPWIVNLLPMLRGLLPSRLFDKVVGDWFGIYDSMKTFKGRDR